MHFSRLAVFLLPLTLVACVAVEPAPLPEGPQTATGVIVPVELSLVRRGTHQVVVAGTPLYFLESSTVNLREAEGKVAGVTGTLSRNADLHDLPVLRVTAISVKEQTPGRTVSLPTFGITIAVPAQWAQVQDAGAVVFSASGAQTLLRISRPQTPGLPEDGVLLLLGGKKAARTRDALGSEHITVDVDGSFIVFELPPFASADLSNVAAREAAMRSVTFASGPASQQSSGAHQSEPMGAYCGGTAGILCPQGSVCIITDPENNVGTCRVSRKPATGVQ